MSFANKTTSLVFAGLLALSAAPAAFAQAGGPDTPSDAKSQGTMENGSSSTGMSKGGAKKHMKKMSKKKKHM